MSNRRRSFAQTIVDTFPGNTLNTSCWIANNGSRSGSLVVNDGLTLNKRAHLA